MLHFTWKTGTSFKIVQTLFFIYSSCRKYPDLFLFSCKPELNLRNSRFEAWIGCCAPPPPTRPTEDLLGSASLWAKPRENSAEDDVHEALGSLGRLRGKKALDGLLVLKFFSFIGVFNRNRAFTLWARKTMRSFFFWMCLQNHYVIEWRVRINVVKAP